MRKKDRKEFRVTDPIEAAFLAQVEVRLVLPEELARCRQEVCEKHYLKSADLVGEQLWYVAEYQGQWLGLLGWSAGAYHLKGRESWIGWNETQRRMRLSLLANNGRFCLLTPPEEHPNLASYVMAACLRRLSEDWQKAYGHPILVVESFVDTQLFRGTSYKATGWKAIGCTAGFKRVAEDFYELHERPKQLFVRELAKHGARTLRARQLPQELAGYERKVDPRCLLGAQEAKSLWQVIHQQVPESRNVHGLRHKQATVLAIAFAYLLSGGRGGGHRAVALFAQDLSPTQRAGFGCWFDRKKRRYDVPSENCIYRVLKAVPVLEFQQAIWAWQKARLGSADGGEVVLDGKAARGSRGTQLVGAVNARSGRALGVEAVADKSNEIPAGQTLLERLDLEGTIALMDALHTQVQTAGTIVQKGGGDFVLVAKGNQKTLLGQAQNLLPEVFSPSADDAGQRPRTHRMERHRSQGCHSRANGFSPRSSTGAG
ncbi:MAG TPA: ISAs1 family transposase [Acidobacteriota bacterium]|nr:ISAs1 family transposase [Acidobacteriota bacterium]